MRSVEIHQLGEAAERLVRQAHARGQIVVLTDAGQPIARIEPVASAQPSPEAGAALLADIQRLAAEIGRTWPPDVSAVEAVREGRRDL